MIDIRSDTVTGPTEGMRKAMAGAAVGDDGYGEDPTVNTLEALGAEITGKEAALFVPSGTFGNQLALFTWCKRGSEVVLGEECHIMRHEAGATAVIAGAQTRPIGAPGGVLPVSALAERLRRRDLHGPGTSLICLENAHSLGRAVPLAALEPVRRIAREWDIPLHLDGARIFNAAAALHVEAAQIAAHADSVMFCLSKGLCAPAGSLLAGPKDFIQEARMRRKLLGGGMRQAGILAAAGIIALKDFPNRLVEDHRRARYIAGHLAAIPGVVITPEEQNINMVFFSYPPAQDQAAAQKIQEVFAQNSIRINAPQDGRYRFVTHYWIGDREAGLVVKAAQEAFAP